MSTFWQDLRYGARILARNPGFTVIAIITLALGIGANTAIFSVVNAVLLRPLPYDDPDRLVEVWQSYPKKGWDKISVSPPNFAHWRDQNQAFSHIAAMAYENFNLTGIDEPERILGYRVSANIFQVLRVEAALGRTFLPDEDQPGQDNVVILNHSLWQRQFGADPSVIGKTLTLNGRSYTVVGIMPPDFRLPLKVDGPLVPLALGPKELSDSQPGLYLQAIARLKPVVLLEQAQAEMKNIARRLEQEYPETNTGSSVDVIPLGRAGGFEFLRLALLVLFGAVGFVLLIACANVVNLLLARATTRQKEISIRTALGAGRWRLIQQLLTESVLLAVLGGAVGVLLALWSIDLVVAIAPWWLHTMYEIELDESVLVFAVLISLLTGAIFGLAPALAASKVDLNEPLKEGGRTSREGFRGRRLRAALVVSEVALAMLLLVGAGLLMRSFVKILSVDPGFNPQNLLTMRVSLPESKFPDARHRVDFYEQVLRRAESLPGVKSVSVVSNLGGGEFRLFQPEGRAAQTSGEEPFAGYQLVSPDYHRAVGIPLLKGRFLTKQDTGGAVPVAIINETLARRYWPDEDPVGEYLTISTPFNDPDKRNQPLPRLIVGVVKDVKQILWAEQSPHIYVPYLQENSTDMILVVRTASEPMNMAPAVQREILAVDKDQPVYHVQTMEEYLSESVSFHRFYTSLIGIFAGLALILAAVGIYGVMNYSVTQRMHEIGIRMALGAQPRAVIKLVVKQGMVMTLLGLCIGLAAALALTKVLLSMFQMSIGTEFLYEVTSTDPLTFVGVSVLLAGVALLACYIPARQATKIDPMAVLKYE